MVEGCNNGMLEKKIKITEYWNTGTVEYWKKGMMEQWNDGMVE